MDRYDDATRLIASATKRGQGRRPVNPPIERASTMLSDRVGDMRDMSLGPVYGLDGTAPLNALRLLVADLERGLGSIVLPSGLAALTLPILTFGRPGDDIVVSDAVYGPTRRFLTRWAASQGIRTCFHPARATADEILAICSETTRMVIIESPSSLTFDMIDVPKLAAGLRDRKILSLMDNTWGAGLAFRPLEHGIDISMQALTKYASGHSDVLMGSATTADTTLLARMMQTYEDLGWHVSPDDAWLVLRGMRTLPVRFGHQAQSALTVAAWLSGRNEIAQLMYPALPGDPGHDLWSRDYKGAAALFGIVLNGGDDAAAERFLESLTLFGLGYSWGGFESLATLETGQVARRNDPPSLAGPLLRLHIGLEHPDDLISDLEAGLRTLEGR
mgnify:CR=1 FL=1